MSVGLSEETSRFVTVNGTRVHYHEAGDGPPLVMLHGGGPGVTGWGNFGPTLPTLAKHFRVLVLDFPGFGQSDKPKIEGDLFRYQASIVVGMMDALGIAQADLVGNSGGGVASLRTALDYPERVRRMVLMGPPATVWLQSPWPTEGIKPVFGFYSPPGPSTERLRSLFETSFVYDISKVPDEVFETRLAEATDPAIQAWYENVFLSAVASSSIFDTWQELGNVQQKTLLTWGREDRTAPLDGAWLPTRMMPNVRLYVFSKGGHWVQIEHTEEFCQLVIDFLGLSE